MPCGTNFGALYFEKLISAKYSHLAAEVDLSEEDSDEDTSFEDMEHPAQHGYVLKTAVIPSRACKRLHAIVKMMAKWTLRIVVGQASSLA